MSFTLERDLSCPICNDVFKDPVILGCSHSFCQHCLQHLWTQKDDRLCPLCKKRHSKERLPPNLVVKILSDNLLRERVKRSDSVCNLHSKTFKLFCVDHREMACVVCRDSERHAGHAFKPVDEAAEEGRDFLQTALKPLRRRLKELGLFGPKLNQHLELVTVQARHTRRNIEEVYKKLHQFLAKDEEARLAALRDEEELKNSEMKKMMEAVSGEMDALSAAIAATEEELKADDASFLLGYKAAVERVEQRTVMDEPQLPSDPHIDVAKHLGNLKYNIWSKMKDVVSYTPVILDPNTTDPDTVLSDDLTSLFPGEMQELPEKVEFSSVLASRGFDSGSHSWDVEVGDNPEWKLGVLAESARKKTYQLSGLWIIDSHNGRYRVLTPSHSYTPVSVRTKPRTIRVTLDQNKDKLTFFDLDTETEIYAFHNKFTERMFPYISTMKHFELKVLPVKVRVWP